MISQKIKDIIQNNPTKQGIKDALKFYVNEIGFNNYIVAESSSAIVIGDELKDQEKRLFNGEADFDCMVIYPENERYKLAKVFTDEIINDPNVDVFMDNIQYGKNRNYISAVFFSEQIIKQLINLEPILLKPFRKTSIHKSRQKGKGIEYSRFFYNDSNMQPKEFMLDDIPYKGGYLTRFEHDPLELGKISFTDLHSISIHNQLLFESENGLYNDLMNAYNNNVSRHLNNSESINDYLSFFNYHREKINNTTQLKKFDSKMISRFKKNYTVTDLHTHFTAILTPEKLVEIGSKYNILIPEYQLRAMKIPTDSFTKHIYEERGNINKLSKMKDMAISLKEIMDSPFIKDYSRRLSLSLDKQSTFVDLRTTYDFRWPYTRLGYPTSDTHNVEYNEEMIRDILKEVALKYKRDGVDYAELSTTTFDLETISMLHKYLPDIEKETRVSLRFLASISRRNHTERLEDLADRIISIAKCPYIVGCDFLGHELNETKHFSKTLKKLAEYAILNDPNFCVKVHAGENELFKDNIKDVFKIIKYKKDELERHKGKKFKYPEVRIGHGVYGMDDESIKLCKEIEAVIEINSTSNYMLNNIDDIRQSPAKRYLDEGIKVVFGTDGPGIYKTDIKKEIANAIRAGVTQKDIENIVQYETQIKNKKQQVFERKMQTYIEQFNEYQDLDVLDSMKKIYPLTYKTKTGEKRNNDKLKTQTKQVEAGKRNNVLELLKNNSINIVTNGTPNKTPIYLSGMEEAELNTLNQAQRKDIVNQIRLLEKIDPQKVYFIVPPLSGIARVLYDQNKGDIEMVSYLSNQSLEEINSKGKQWRLNFNKAILGKTDFNKMPSNDFSMASHIASDIKKDNGLAIFVGGAGTTRDYIQQFHNEGCQIFLSTVSGSSQKKSKFLANENTIAYNGVHELLNHLQRLRPEIFKNHIKERRNNI